MWSSGFKQDSSVGRDINASSSQKRGSVHNIMLIECLNWTYGICRPTRLFLGILTTEYGLALVQSPLGFDDDDDDGDDHDLSKWRGNTNPKH